MVGGMVPPVGSQGPFGNQRAETSVPFGARTAESISGRRTGETRGRDTGESVRVE